MKGAFLALLSTWALLLQVFNSLSFKIYFLLILLQVQGLDEKVDVKFRHKILPLREMTPIEVQSYKNDAAFKPKLDFKPTGKISPPSKL